MACYLEINFVHQTVWVNPEWTRPMGHLKVYGLSWKDPTKRHLGQERNVYGDLIWGTSGSGIEWVFIIFTSILWKRLQLSMFLPGWNSNSVWDYKALHLSKWTWSNFFTTLLFTWSVRCRLTYFFQLWMPTFTSNTIRIIKEVHLWGNIENGQSFYIVSTIATDFTG